MGIRHVPQDCRAVRVGVACDEKSAARVERNRENRAVRLRQAGDRPRPGAVGHVL